MGIKRLHRIENYWSERLNFCCNSPKCSCQPLVFGNFGIIFMLSTIPRKLVVVSQVKLSQFLKEPFFLDYAPGQELSIDEAMIKYKDHVKVKSEVCCCSCCGYLCIFQIYEGKQLDPAVSGKFVSE